MNLSKIEKIKHILTIILLIGFLIPQDLKMPVVGASKSDYNAKSFWFYPWRKSVTHKGVDIFAKEGVRVNSATKGLVIYKGNIKYGGNVVLVLGPKWRIHYYAHLKKLTATNFSFVNNKSQIGIVGVSGNAKGKQPHLHYSIATLVPYFWRIDSSHQGWKKMFYLDPINYMEH